MPLYNVNLNFLVEAPSLRDAIARAKDHAQVLPGDVEGRIKIVAVFDGSGKVVQYGEDE